MVQPSATQNEAAVACSPPRPHLIDHSNSSRSHLARPEAISAQCQSSRRLCGDRLAHLPEPEHASGGLNRELLELHGGRFDVVLGDRAACAAQLKQGATASQPSPAALHGTSSASLRSFSISRSTSSKGTEHSAARHATASSYLCWRANRINSASLRRPVSFIICARRCASSMFLAAGFSAMISLEMLASTLRITSCLSALAEARSRARPPRSP